jgi:RNA polymerase sigma factor (sigma-70 family)
MDDAQLVVAARAGDPNAIEAIYDAYADGIHDFCASMLRNRAEATDAVQETFVVAFDSLEDLAEPSRLRSWLYALAHRAVRDVVARRGLPFYAGDEDLVAPSGGPDESLSRAELAEFVWQATCGLDLAERVLLDLHLRQGLEGRDLAGAAGVPPPQLEGRVHRLEAHVERSIGALLVARTSRRTCPELFGVLNSGDGEDLRERVTAHVDDCERCLSRRRIAPNPLTLLVTTPMAAAPAYLRRVVLAKAEAGRDAAPVRWAFNREGFPELSAGPVIGDQGTDLTTITPAASTGPVFASTRDTTVMPVRSGAGALAAGGAVGAAGGWVSGGGGGDRRGGGGTAGGSGGDGGSPPTTVFRPPDDHDRRGALIGGLAGLIILIAAIVIVVSSRGHGSSGTVGVTATTTATTVATTTTLAQVALPTVVSSSTVPHTTVAPKGHLIVGSKTLDLGVSATNVSVQIGNDGAAPADFTASTTGTGLTVSPPVGSLTAGASQTLQLTLDRSVAAPGAFTGSVLIASPAGNSTIPVTAMIDPGPMITNDVATPTTLSATSCPTYLATTKATVTATVTSAQPLNTAPVLHRMVSRVEKVDAMASTGGGGYTGVLGPFPTTGTVEWWIVAVDSAYVTTSSPHQFLTVAC